MKIEKLFNKPVYPIFIRIISELRIPCWIIKWNYKNREWVSEIAQLCPTLCDPVDCSLLGSSVYGILQARILEWVASSFSRASSPPRDLTHVPCIGREILYHWATREALTFFSIPFSHPPQAHPRDLATPDLFPVICKERPLDCVPLDIRSSLGLNCFPLFQPSKLAILSLQERPLPCWNWKDPVGWS